MAFDTGGNRKYNHSLVVLNKVDMVSEQYLKAIKFDYVPVSAEKSQNIEELKKMVGSKSCDIDAVKDAVARLDNELKNMNREIDKYKV